MVKDHLKGYRFDQHSERYSIEAMEMPYDVFWEILEQYGNKYFFKTARLKDFIPFRDGFDFRNKFRLKINLFGDFERHYERYLIENGLSENYRPFCWNELRD